MKKTKINRKTEKPKNQKTFLFLSFLVFWFFSLSVIFFRNLYAKEITILYTGDTHAMLYPCSCPIEQDGGVARRASLIKELRKKNSDILVLDSGAFFAGGILDEYTQNTELDIQRTKVNIKAMEMMKYDVVNVGDDEFNFGRAFLEERISDTKIPFISCNIRSDKIAPFIIKDVGGIKIAIIGVNGLFAKQKASELEFIEPKIAVKSAVEALKKKNVDIIILLSRLGVNQDNDLINEVGGIDVLIEGYSRQPQEPVVKTGSTLVVRSFWQARKLGKLSLTVENNKIVNYAAEELRISDKTIDDKDILSFLPRCFSDIGCKKDGFIGACQNPGNLKANCQFRQATRINLTIITSKQCRVCNSEPVITYLKRQFPGITVSYLYYPDAAANTFIKDFGIKILPAYLVSKTIEKESGFNDDLKKNMDAKGDFYILKPQFSGLSYFLERKKVEGKLDLFISLYEKNTKDLLDLIKEFNPTIHFLAIEQGNGFGAAQGNLEVEEYLRSVCVQKYYPEQFFDYIGCRAKNLNSSWWEDCAINEDINKIKTCARSKEGIDLLKENIGLNGAIQAMFGPIYLLDNQEAFRIQGNITKEALKEILKNK